MPVTEAKAVATGGAMADKLDRGGDQFTDYGTNPWVDAEKDRLSTFAADVDTASYTLARRVLLEGSLPVKASVRVEEFVNYFTYKFPEPTSSTPFAVVMEAAPQYWQSPEALKSLYVVLPGGQQVPFSAFSHYEMTNAPLSVSHQSTFPTTTVNTTSTANVKLTVSGNVHLTSVTASPAAFTARPSGHGVPGDYTDGQSTTIPLRGRPFSVIVTSPEAISLMSFPSLSTAMNRERISGKFDASTS